MILDRIVEAHFVHQLATNQHLSLVIISRNVSFYPFLENASSISNHLHLPFFTTLLLQPVAEAYNRKQTA